MNRIAIKLIESYQKKFSAQKNNKCRHFPTCSAYAKEAYQTYNFFKASFLTTKRLLKCNPLFKPSYDPLPVKKKSKKCKLNKKEH